MALKKLDPKTQFLKYAQNAKVQKALRDLTYAIYMNAYNDGFKSFQDFYEKEKQAKINGTTT